MELFLIMGEDYTKDGTLGRACHKRRKRSTKPWRRRASRKRGGPFIARWRMPASAAKPFWLRSILSRTTEAFFVVSSGRSGTAMLHKALSAYGRASRCITNTWCISFSPLAVRRTMA